ncbi:MAG: FGGY family carbohydrate kinase, partial [Brevinematales bacterium]
MDKKYIGAIDQGTSSTRFVIYDRDGKVKASSQMEHSQIYPKPGWVEHDAMEIWDKTCFVIKDALGRSGIKALELAAIGITNQRETTVVWDKETGFPCHNAIVWQDTRTAGIIAELGGKEGPGRFREKTGLPLATYFSGPKIKWLLDNVPGLRESSGHGRVLFGTIDSWICWKLTGRHVTDTTNASRTLLFDINKLAWDSELLDVMGINKNMMPEVRPSSSMENCPLTGTDGPFGAQIPLSGFLGDQQAALFGQACFDKGDAKNTYGTGCFLLMNCGAKPVISSNGLLTTVGY